MKTKLEKTIDRLAREKGYPHMLLTYSQYMQVLKAAHQIVFGKPSNRPLTSKAPLGNHGKRK